MAIRAHYAAGGATVVAASVALVVAVVMTNSTLLTDARGVALGAQSVVVEATPSSLESPELVVTVSVNVNKTVPTEKVTPKRDSSAKDQRSAQVSDHKSLVRTNTRNSDASTTDRHHGHKTPSREFPDRRDW
ncbi:hypothetical protein ACWPKO_18890 (plasmid) [Coraliomargarita sp. W4R53]